MFAIYVPNREVDCESTQWNDGLFRTWVCPALKLCPWPWPQVVSRIWSLSHAWKSTKGHYLANGFLFGIPSSASYWNVKAHTMQMAYFINTNRSPGSRCFGDWGERRSLYFSNSNNSDDKFLPLNILSREQRKMEFSSPRSSMVFKSRKIKISIFGQRVLMCRKLWWKEMNKKSEACSVNFPGLQDGQDVYVRRAYINKPESTALHNNKSQGRPIICTQEPS